MKRHLIMLVTLGVAASLFARQQDHQADRLARAAQVIKTMMTVPGRGIPAQLMQRALCIGIIPSALNIELGLGAHFGRGALVCRVEGGKAWSAPWMFTVGGASYGLIPEGDSANVVFLVMTSRCERKLMKSCLKVGADASESPGPVAAKSGITSVPIPHSDMVAYSIKQGKFSGASLEGVILKPDDDANLHLYGHRVDPGEVLTNAAFPLPAAAKPLEEMLARFCLPGREGALAKD
ncbi:MAG: lipid-binding SYLF domain-containing protein [Terriglobia bacterium]